jgi:hypothetical protein
MKPCENCQRKVVNNTCFIPTDASEQYSEWKKNRLVLNADGTCDYHKPETWKHRVSDWFRFEWYRIQRYWENVVSFFKYQIFNRIKHGFDIRDSWSLFSNTAKYVRPRLRRMIDNDPHGCPSIFTTRAEVEANNLSQYFSGELQDEWFDHESTIDEPMKAWINVLEAIYFSIDYCVDEKNDECFSTNEFGEMVYDREKGDALHAKVSEGLRLFGLLFQNLWD